MRPRLPRTTTHPPPDVSNRPHTTTDPHSRARTDRRFVEDEAVARVAYPWHNSASDTAAQESAQWQRVQTATTTASYEASYEASYKAASVITMVPAPATLFNYPDEPVEPTAVPAMKPGVEGSLDEFRLFTDEGVVVVLALASADVAHLKEMVQLQLNLSPRLEILLSLASAQGGGVLPDDAPIFDYSRTAASTRDHPGRSQGTIAHGRHMPAVDDLSLSSRPYPLSGFDKISPAVAPPSQLRVRACKGGIPFGAAVLVRGVQPGSTVNDIKSAVIKAPQLFAGIESAGGDPDKVSLYFSQVFFAPDVLLGRRARSTLAGIAPLSSCKLVKDDILYVEYLAAEAYHKPTW